MAWGSDISGYICGSMGQVARSLFTGVNEELPETEHVLRERVKPSELEPKQRLSLEKREVPLHPVLCLLALV